MLTASGYTSASISPDRERRAGYPSERPGGRGVSLDPGTQVVSPEPDGCRGWLVKAFPAAREAVVVLQGGGQGRELASAPVDEAEALRRQLDNVRRVARRRRAECRRYCVANVLTVLWTFTYREANHDRDRVVRDFQLFVRRFRAEWGPLPYLYVLELHPGGHGWHVHMALPGRHFSHKRMGELWGHGFVHYRKSAELDEGEPGPGRGGRDAARRVAAYVSKYLTKDMSPGEGRHGYAVGERFAVRERLFRMVPSLRAVRALIGHWGLGDLAWQCSDSWAGWNGPPTYVLREA